MQDPPVSCSKWLVYLFAARFFQVVTMRWVWHGPMTLKEVLDSCTVLIAKRPLAALKMQFDFEPHAKYLSFKVLSSYCWQSSTFILLQLCIAQCCTDIFLLLPESSQVVENFTVHFQGFSTKAKVASMSWSATMLRYLVTEYVLFLWTKVWFDRAWQEWTVLPSFEKTSAPSPGRTWWWSSLDTASWELSFSDFCVLHRSSSHISKANPKRWLSRTSLQVKKGYMCLAHGALESDGPMRVAATLEMQSSESPGFIWIYHWLYQWANGCQRVWWLW